MAEVEVIAVKAKDGLNKMLIDHPDMNKKVKKILSSVIRRARTNVSKGAKDVVGSGFPNSNGDPRAAYKAVKHTIYKRILGGSVSILAKKRASSTRVRVERSRKLDLNPHQRGGNRRRRSSETERMDSYYASDRGFILRFLNAGTSGRMTRFGNRGRISATNWFHGASQKEMEAAAEEFCRLVEEEMLKQYNNG